MSHTTLDLERLLRIPYVDAEYGFEVSPAGTQVAFAWNRTGRWEIYLAPLDGSAPPRPVTGGPGAKFAPRWSPALPGRLAYVLDPDGGENYILCTCDLATGRHTNLTPHTPDPVPGKTNVAIQPSYAWSPDGSQIAFIFDRGGRFDTYVMPVGGGAARLVLDLPYPDWEVRWSPAGHWLAVVTATQGQDDDTFLAPAGGGEPRRITAAGRPVHARAARWSPDGRRIAFASNLHGHSDIGLYALETGQVEWVTRGQGDREQPAWSPDGRRLVYVVGEGPQNILEVLDLEAGSATSYRVEPGVHARPQFTPNGAYLVFAFENPRRPSDLWRLSLADGAFRQLTHSLPPDLDAGQLVMPEPVCYPSLDGVRVPALLYRPRRVEGRPPAVVYVHGGPNSLAQVAWDPLIQHLVGRGWVVLAPNYRGSTGYGRAWQLASRFDLGGCDTQDVVAATDYLARAGLADPARFAVTGRSWGGYLTLTCLTGYPDRWAAGSAVVPFLNWFTGHTHSREDLQHWDLENFGHPEKDYALYYERSPFFFLNRVTAPVQLICGANDPRCPASESLQARDALAALGKPCDLALYPDEGHVFLKTENVVDAERRRVAFLAGVLER